MLAYAAALLVATAGMDVAGLLVGAIRDARRVRIDVGLGTVAAAVLATG